MEWVAMAAVIITVWLVLWVGGLRLWRALGRRRTEARLREESSRLMQGQEWAEEMRQRPNGATSSERSRKPSATDGNTRGR